MRRIAAAHVAQSDADVDRPVLGHLLTIGSVALVLLIVFASLYYRAWHIRSRSHTDESLDGLDGDSSQQQWLPPQEQKGKEGANREAGESLDGLDGDSSQQQWLPPQEQKGKEGAHLETGALKSTGTDQLDHARRQSGESQDPFLLVPILGLGEKVDVGVDAGIGPSPEYTSTLLGAASAPQLRASGASASSRQSQLTVASRRIIDHHRETMTTHRTASSLMPPQAGFPPATSPGAPDEAGSWLIAISNMMPVIDEMSGACSQGSLEHSPVCSSTLGSPVAEKSTSASTTAPVCSAVSAIPTVGGGMQRPSAVFAGAGGELQQALRKAHQTQNQRARRQHPAKDDRQPHQ